MTTKIIKPRIRLFVGGEGESERSFVKLLQIFSDQMNLHLHLDCEPLGGGGYELMLNEAVRIRQKKERLKKFKHSILLVDADRTIRDDLWSPDALRKQGSKKKMTVIFQQPKHEGLLLRMLPGNESLQPDAASAHEKLCTAWPKYKKPMDASALREKYSLNDLLRTARVDSELSKLLTIIGFITEKSFRHNKSNTPEFV